MSNTALAANDDRRGRSRNVRQGDKGARTRQLIKDALVQLLARKSVDDIVLDDICQETQLTVGAFYFHFRNKDAALEEVAIDALHTFYGRVLSLPASDDFPADVAGLAAELVQVSVNDPSLMLLMSEGVRSKQAARLAWMEEHARLTERLVEQLAAHRGRAVTDQDRVDVQYTLFAAETFMEHSVAYREPGLSLIRERPDELKAMLSALMLRSLNL